MRVIFRLLREAKKYWGLIALTMVCLLVLTAAQLYAPGIMGEFTKLIEDKNPDIKNQAFRLAGILAVTYAIQCIAQGLRSYISHKAAWNFVSDMRTKLYNHYQNLSIEFFHDKQVGQLMSRVISDTSNLELLIAHAVPDLIVNVFLFIGVAILLFTINVKLALVSLIVLPFLAVSSRWFSKKVRPRFVEGQKVIGELSAELQDNLSGIKEIQLFNQQEREYNDINKISKKHIKALLSPLKLGAIYHPGVQFVNSIGTVLVIGYGGYLASVNQVSLSSIVTFILYLGIFYQPITALARINEDIQNALAGADRIFEMLDTPPAVKEKPDALNLCNPKGELDFENVYFSYNDGTEVLNNVSFSAKQGQIIALIGQTGVGKTTVVSLLGRFYDPVSGRILLDGHDLRDLTLKDLHDSMSIVFQDVFLFNGTVRDNISYGQPDADDAQIEKAAKLAHAHDFIQNLENGYETYIGERGIKLSGGQKQRLSIARAILRNRPVLILDEATSAVDVETEKLIQNAMDTVMENRTTIIIAHRLSTVKKADKIIVLHEGKIAEIGTHSELIEKNGIYAKYSTTQLVM